MEDKYKNNDEINATAEVKQSTVSGPRDTGGFYYSSAIKITDADSGEILVQQRTS